MGLLQFLKSQFLCHLIICYVFLVSGLIVNLIQICTLPLWLVSKQLARKINIRLAYCIASQMVAALEWWSGTECMLYTDPKSYPLYGKENAIVVLNHTFEIDFLCGWTFCERFGVLGSSKVLAKKELAYVPVIGWMWYFLEIVFCKRKWEEDRTTVAQSLQKLRDYPENYWFLLFCEGTRFTPKKHQFSMQVAESKGLPKLKYHLLPRTKGFYVTVQNLRGTAAAIYDSTLNFRNNEVPTLLGILNGKKYHADLCVRRIPLESVPEDEAECAAWLHKLYLEKQKQTAKVNRKVTSIYARRFNNGGVHLYYPGKVVTEILIKDAYDCTISGEQMFYVFYIYGDSDGFQEQYAQTGRFPGQIVSPPRRPWSLINWLFWSCVVLYPLGLLIAQLLSSGSVVTITAAVIVCSAVSLGMRWMIGQTEIDKSSNYGIKAAPLNNN